MKKIIIFITDLYNTYFANENMYIRDLETQKLLLNLEKLRILHHADNVYFEFITMESKEVLDLFIKELSLYLPNTKIILHRQICKDGIFYPIQNNFFFEKKSINKLKQIHEEITSFQEEYDVKAIYYADDALFYSEELLKDHIKNLNLIVPSMIEYDEKLFTSKHTALEGVNECLVKKIKTFVKKV